MTFLQDNYSQLVNQLAVVGAIIAGVVAAPVAATRLIAAFRLSLKAAWITIGLSALTALLFLVPFIVWTQNGIAYYTGAVIFAGLLAAATCFAGYRYLRRFVSAPETLTTA